MTEWQNRIVGFDLSVDPEQLLANPRNWRIHGMQQSAAIRASLSEIGWIDAVIVNVTTGHVVDGHLRAAEAISAERTVPVMYVELSEDEELKALATFDLITNLADTDVPALESISADVAFDNAVLAEVIAEACGTVDDGETPEPPGGTDDTALLWGYVQWDKSKRIRTTESEVTDLDTLFEMYLSRNRSDTGFVRWLVEGRMTDEPA
jgi:hypothetical protein